MKVEFEGTPEQVLRDMREFIARCALLFGEEAESPALPPKTEPKASQEVLTPTPNIIQAKDPQIPDFALTRPVKSDALKVCKFCSDTFQRLPIHERFCKENPNRTPHRLEGKPRPQWLTGRRSKIAQDYAKGAFDVE